MAHVAWDISDQQQTSQLGHPLQAHSTMYSHAEMLHMGHVAWDISGQHHAALSSLTCAALKGYSHRSVPALACGMLQNVILQQLLRVLNSSDTLASAAPTQPKHSAHTPGGIAAASYTLYTLYPACRSLALLDFCIRCSSPY
jgi:hypothetical protein